MNISLSDHFTYKKLLRFTFPSVVMMILTSIYGVVDGVFVSNFVGSEAFASINIIMPFLMILGAIGFMTGSGGSALVALTFGTGNEKKAKEIFSLLVYVLIAVGFLFTVGGEILLAPMARLLGADEILLPYCVRYGRIKNRNHTAFLLSQAQEEENNSNLHDVHRHQLFHVIFAQNHTVHAQKKQDHDQRVDPLGL